MFGHRASLPAHGGRSLEGAAAPSPALWNQLERDGVTRANCRKVASIHGGDHPIIHAFCHRNDDRIDVAHLGIPIVRNDLRSAHPVLVSRRFDDGVTSRDGVEKRDLRVHAEALENQPVDFHNDGFRDDAHRAPLKIRRASLWYLSLRSASA